MHRKRSRKGSLRDFSFLLRYNDREVRTMRDIGKNIKDLRTQKNMTQDELAEKLFVTRQTVSNYETGKSRPDIDMLIQIAEVLGADIHDLLYGPAAKRDRREDHIRFASAAGISIIFWILIAILDDYTRELYFRFLLAPRILLYFIFLPTAFFFSGWALMQLLCLFTGLRPLNGKYVPWIRRIILAVLIGVFLFMLPYYIDLICDSVQYLIFKAQEKTGSYTYRGFFKMTALHRLLWGILANHPAALAFFGGMLWLFPSSKHKTKKAEPDKDT